VLQYLKSITAEVVGEMVASDPAAARIHASFSEFLSKSAEYQRITEQAFLETRQ
jgi:TRAP-type mannitol/chloroaromatic compound transport system substrate-binding protein